METATATENNLSNVEIERWRKRWKIALKDTWIFLIYFCCTWDEHEKTSLALAKPFPRTALFRFLCRCWMELDVIFIEKARQIMMTWFFAAMFLHDILARVVRRNMFQSKKQEDANNVLDRSRHIYERLVIDFGDFLNIPRVKMYGEKHGTDTQMVIEATKSLLWAIPQGPDIVRSYTTTGILSDESEYQPKFSDGYTAAMPSFGNGHFIAVSSVNGYSAAWRILYGIPDGQRRPSMPNLIDSRKVTKVPYSPPSYLTEEQKRHWIEKKLLSLSDEEYKSIPLEVLAAMMPGVEYWRTADETDSLRLHYSSDPKKDPVTEKGSEWVNRQKKRMKSQKRWNREMEMRRDQPEGGPVIENWRYDTIVPKKSIPVDPGKPIIVMVDFGSNVACAGFAQYLQITIGDKLVHFFQSRILDETHLEHSNTYVLGDKIIKKMKDRFPAQFRQRNFKVWCDPAGHASSPTTADRSRNTDIKILKSKGLPCYSRKFGVTESTDHTRAIFATFHDDGTPAVQVDPRCQYLISCLEGGWHYPKDSENDGKPEKDGIFEHGGDIIRIFMASTVKPNDIIMPPSYQVRRRLVRAYGGRVIGSKTEVIRT